MKKRTFIILLFSIILCNSQNIFATNIHDEKFVNMIDNLDKKSIEKSKTKLLYDDIEKIDVSGITLYKDREKINNENIAVSVNIKLKVLTVWAYNEEKDEYNIPIRAVACSPNTKRTPRGLFHPEHFYNSFHEMYGDSNYCLYCIRIHNQFLIHSPLFEKRSSNTLKVDSYNSIGKSDSGGCVRLVTGDAAWLHERLNKKSPVYLYDSDYRGPLAAEKIKLIDENQTYDPTDPSIINEFAETGKKIESKTNIEAAQEVKIKIKPPKKKKIVDTDVSTESDIVINKKKEERISTKSEISTTNKVSTTSVVSTASILVTESEMNETRQTESEKIITNEENTEGGNIIAPISSENQEYEAEPESDF